MKYVPQSHNGENSNHYIMVQVVVQQVKIAQQIKGVWSPEILKP